MRLIVLVAISLVLGGVVLGATPGAAAFKCTTNITHGIYVCSHGGLTIVELRPGCVATLESCPNETPT